MTLASTLAAGRRGKRGTWDDPGMTPVPGTAAGQQPGDPADPMVTDIIAGPGGVMTEEVGVITGDLTLRTERDSLSVVVRVQYKDAAEWYTVTGSRVDLVDPRDAATVHRLAVGLLNRPEG